MYLINKSRTRSHMMNAYIHHMYHEGMMSSIYDHRTQEWHDELQRKQLLQCQVQQVLMVRQIKFKSRAYQLVYDINFGYQTNFHIN